MNRKLLEAGKTALIVLLLAGAVFFAGKTGLFSSLFSSVPAIADFKQWLSPQTDGSQLQNTRETESESACFPLTVAVTGISGYHYGLKYDQEALDTFNSRTATLLGEALGSSGEPVGVPESEWRDALKSAGIFLDYGNPVPLSAIPKWSVGTDIVSGASAHASRRFCLSADASMGIALYYQTPDGSYYRCSTAVLYSSVADILNDYLPNGASFAFEMDELYKNLDPYFLILPGIGSTAAVTAGSPINHTLPPEKLIGIFQISPYLSAPYKENPDTVKYVEGNCSLRIVSGTDVYYHINDLSGDRFKLSSTADSASVPEMLEAARALVASSLGAYCGKARLYYTGMDNTDEGHTFYFDYYIGGLQVALPSGSHAASVTVRGGYITEAALYFRSYTAMSEKTAPIPELQAAAIVSHTGVGKELTLGYYDQSGTMTPDWIVK